MADIWDYQRAEYLEMIREEIPAYDALQAALAGVTRHLEPTRILDLGTGTGVTAATVLAVHPGARLVGVDSSEAMLSEAARELPEATLVVGDLADPLPTGPFDLVVSALAIHHLEHAEKALLFDRVAAVMTPGARFVLLDVVVPTALPERPVILDPDIDKPSTVAEHLEWLGMAGLEAQVVHDHCDLVIFVADRPA